MTSQPTGGTASEKPAVGTATTDKKILQLTDIHKRFPGVYALKGVRFELRPGEIHALMGENGAGKSTLIKVISVAHLPDSGQYLIDGEDALIANPHDAIAKGVSVIYQELNLAPNITVAENMALGCLPTGGMGVVKRGELRRATKEVLDGMALDIDLDSRLGLLPIAQQQLVELAKAIYKKPRVLVMDEPTSALSAREIDALFVVIQRLAASGVAVAYVSHKIEEIFRLCNRVTVLRDGEYIGTKDIGELDEKALVSMMVGREYVSAYQRNSGKTGSSTAVISNGSAAGEGGQAAERIVLEVKNLNSDRVRDISFHVKAGEIVGFFGLMGAGRSELVRAVFGADERQSGQVLIEGKALGRMSTSEAARHGIGYITENRKDEGILPSLDVCGNMTISSLRQFIPRLAVATNKERTSVSQMIDRLRIKTAGLGQNIANLSGGNQQKVLIARWLIKTGLKVLIIDEPTRGIDVGAKAEIYALMDGLAAAGMGIVCVTSEMNEIMSICDRIYVMKRGRISGECLRADATPEKLFALSAMDNARAVMETL
ncbi:MAG: sugar ABC transporter ATP-binding protein [Planctomycetes bacterium]|nr:sugar ABC transporter ATP-binding protein [Planctomycetota bacterium]